MKDDGHDTCRDREEDLRAELAALREEVTRAVTAQMADRALNRKLRRDAERARALLARVVSLFLSHREHQWPACTEGEVAEAEGLLHDTRAFLDQRRDEARRNPECICPDDGVNEECRATERYLRDKARWCTCHEDPGLIGTDEHDIRCPLRDEGPRECNCDQETDAGQPHLKTCPARDEAPWKPSDHPGCTDRCSKVGNIIACGSNCGCAACGPV